MANKDNNTTNKPRNNPLENVVTAKPTTQNRNFELIKPKKNSEKKNSLK